MEGDEVTAFEVMRKHYGQRDLAAREWKKNGGKVVGYIGSDVPEEMVLAAGLFPLRISGNPSGGTELADKYMEPVFDPMVRSIFNRVLDGTYSFVDHLIISNSADALVRFFYYLREIKHVEPRVAVPDFYFFDILRTRFRTSAIYNRARTRELAEKLESWAGTRLTDEGLSQAITVCNENRRLLEEVARLRRAEPPRLSGVDALQIIGSSMFMMKSEHNSLLQEFLSQADALPRRSGVRLFVDGSALDNLQFYEIVESCDSVIVGETTDWGNRYFEDLVSVDCGPWDAVVDRYHFKAPAPSKYPVSVRVEYCVRKALEAKAQGVVFFILDADDAPSWDYPEQRKALEAHGVPSLCLDMQQYVISDIEVLKSKIKAFIDESVKR